MLHDVAQTKTILTVSTSPNMIYMDQTVMLKVVPVQLHNGKKTLNIYAVLDDGSERTIILPAAVQYLNLKGKEELLSLRTIRQDKVQLKGAHSKCHPWRRKG